MKEGIPLWRPTYLRTHRPDHHWLPIPPFFHQYVAVTGIPNPQEKHALIMVRFARECMMKTNQLTHDVLAEQLGDDTRELEMRVGLHSGPTTAGVLRGDRGRFQLFGDTVNTASRMESTGIRGQIHCSQATADQLILKGKSDWLKPREEKINPKGKGEMQTYWILTANPATTTATSSSGSVDIDNLDDSLDLPLTVDPDNGA